MLDQGNLGPAPDPIVVWAGFWPPQQSLDQQERQELRLSMERAPMPDPVTGASAQMKLEVSVKGDWYPYGIAVLLELGGFAALRWLFGEIHAAGVVQGSINYAVPLGTAKESPPTIDQQTTASLEPPAADSTAAVDSAPAAIDPPPTADSAPSLPVADPPAYESEEFGD